MTLPDLTTYADADLAALQDALDVERTRRSTLATTVVQVTGLAAAYVAAGGAVADLNAAVSSA